MSDKKKIVLPEANEALKDKFRQGDVGLIPLIRLLTDEEIRKVCKPVIRPLAYGEVSGHHHVAVQLLEDRPLEEGRQDGDMTLEEAQEKLGDEASTLFLTEDGRMILRAKEGTVVKHVVEKTGSWTKDHNHIALPPGDYEVRGQDEYTPKGRQRVVD